MSFWKRHKALRGVLMAVLFLAGITLVLIGWGMTGQLSGLGLMLVGILLLLIVLLLYNSVF